MCLETVEPQWRDCKGEDNGIHDLTDGPLSTSDFSQLQGRIHREGFVIYKRKPILQETHES